MNATTVVIDCKDINSRSYCVALFLAYQDDKISTILALKLLTHSSISPILPNDKAEASIDERQHAESGGETPIELC